jgi:hypothetical protein
MKKIGEGYYYNVFEVNTDTVLKTVKTKLRIFLFIFFANKFNISNTKQEYNKVLTLTPRLKTVYRKILKTISDKSLIGNPLFINEIDYKQDRVRELRNVNDLNERDFVKVIGDYINLLKKLWSFGVSDSVFNFSINCGYNKKNELVLIDFNEITFDKSEVGDQIINKVWLQRSSYMRLTKEKQQLFNKIFNREITLENLEKYWAREGSN